MRCCVMEISGGEKNREDCTQYNMELQKKRSLCLHLIIILLHNVAGIVLSADKFSRKDFPPDFVFGAGTSAYQVEGATNEDGRTASIWDTFAHDGYMGGDNGDVACDGYHKYKEDVQLMVETRLEAYKFSISWSRLIPNGRGLVNPKGVLYYNNLINELIKHGIQPHVTLYNFDMPQVLEDEYGGFLNRKIIRDFVNYADVCFREFGDRVLHWNTVNEPNIYALGSYDQGITPPARCSRPFGLANCSQGNSIYEPYLAHHYMLLAHAATVRLYREKYQDKQHGVIGLTVYTFGMIPGSDREEDLIATERAFDFNIGWDLDPIVHGDYPAIMKKLAGPKLPAFSESESKQLKGSFDFIGIIYYTTFNITNNPNNLKIEESDYSRDSAANSIDPHSIHSDDNTPPSSSVFRGLLEIVKKRYANPPIFIYENGHLTNVNSSLDDVSRVKYLHAYIGGVLDLLRGGSDIRGYFVWSFMDLFELLNFGFKTSYGLYYVDQNDPDLKRHPKLSAHWYSRFLEGRSVSTVGTISLNNISDIHVSHLFA